MATRATLGALAKSKGHAKPESAKPAPTVVPPVASAQAPGFFTFRRDRVYYTNLWRRLGDFCAGVLLAFLFNVVLFPFLLERIPGFSYFSIAGYTNPISVGIFYVLFLLLNVFIITMLFWRRRQYLAIGFLITAILPMIVYGACLNVSW
jgi:hypothetical protein